MISLFKRKKTVSLIFSIIKFTEFIIILINIDENEDEKKTRLAKELLNKISQNIEDDK